MTVLFLMLLLSSSLSLPTFNIDHVNFYTKPIQMQMYIKSDGIWYEHMISRNTSFLSSLMPNGIRMPSEMQCEIVEKSDQIRIVYVCVSGGGKGSIFKETKCVYDFLEFHIEIFYKVQFNKCDYNSAFELFITSQSEHVLLFSLPYVMPYIERIWRINWERFANLCTLMRVESFLGTEIFSSLKHVFEKYFWRKKSGNNLEPTRKPFVQCKNVVFFRSSKIVVIQTEHYFGLIIGALSTFYCAY